MVAKLPLRLTAPTPKPGYPKQFKHLGDHLRARRIDLGLLQREVAARIGVEKATLMNWELGHTAPAPAAYPAIIAFLGCDRRPIPATAGAVIRRARLTRGWSLADLAVQAGVDPASVARVEVDTKGVTSRVRQAIRRVLGLASV